MYVRNCPNCNIELTYKTVSLYNRAIKNNKGCRPCGQKVTKKENGYDVWNKGLTKKDPRVEYNCRNAFGKNGNHSTIVRKGKTYEDIYGVQKAKEVKVKQSNNRNGEHWPNYNKNSIQVIEQYGKENGYTFQHAENGGEVSFITKQGNMYFVDGYDKENNVVIEYYERYHRYNTEYDIKRKQELISLLGCKFIEIKEYED